MNEKAPKLLIIWLSLCMMTLPAMALLNPTFAEEVNWLETRIKDTPSSVTSIVIGDADNDGENEVLAGLFGPQSGVRMYKESGGIFSEQIIITSSESVYSLALGDCDNDGKNEVVIGMLSTTNEIRAYKYASGIWVEDIVADTPTHVYSLAVGDADSDGKNDIVCGLATSTNELRRYTKSNGTWVENPIWDVPANIRSLGILDADNDGKKEVVIGMDSCINEIRAYENASGVWTEDVIVDTSNNVYEIALGDADNDGQNEVVCGLASSTNELKVYKKAGASWAEEIVYDTPQSVWSLSIGDCDNDGANEIVIGMLSTSFELRAYEKIESLWSQEIIANLPQDVYSVSVGDADSDGDNEVWVGLWSTSYEVRKFEYDIGSMMFTNVKDGDYVKGTVCLEVAATSGSLEEVRFYLNGELTHADSQSPYQFILDTTPLLEDAVYTLKAEGIISNVPPIFTQIDVRINNAVDCGNYITVDTLKTLYEPDSDVSVLVSTLAPPYYDHMGLIVYYQDFLGNMKFSSNETMPVCSQYLTGVPIFSDAGEGLYTVGARAYGYHKGELIWYSEAQNTFSVAGSNLHAQLEGINTTLSGMESTVNDMKTAVSELTSELEGMSLADISQNLAYLNVTLNSKIDGLYDNLEDMNTSLSEKMNHLEDLLEVLTSELDGVNATIHDELTYIILSSSAFYTLLGQDITTLYNQIIKVESDLAAQHDFINGAIAGLNSTLVEASELSTDEIILKINDSLKEIAIVNDSLTNHDYRVEEVLNQLAFVQENRDNLTKTEILENISDVLGELEEVDYDMVFHDIAIKEDITSLTDILLTLRDANLTDLAQKFQDLTGSVSQYDTRMGDSVSGFSTLVSDFRLDTEDRLVRINESLEDLEKLDGIIRELAELESASEATSGKTQKSEDDSSNLIAIIMMLSVFCLAMLFVVLYISKENRGLKSTLQFDNTTTQHTQKRWGQNKFL